MLREIAEHSTSFLIVDSKNIRTDILGNAIKNDNKYAVVCTNNGCPKDEMSDNNSFVGYVGLGSVITTEYVDLFLSTLGWQNTATDVSLLTTGIYREPDSHRTMKFYKKSDTIKTNTLQEKLNENSKKFIT